MMVSKCKKDNLRYYFPLKDYIYMLIDASKSAMGNLWRHIAFSVRRGFGEGCNLGGKEGIRAFCNFLMC